MSSNVRRVGIGVAVTSFIAAGLVVSIGVARAADSVAVDGAERSGALSQTVSGPDAQPDVRRVPDSRRHSTPDTTAATAVGPVDMDRLVLLGDSLAQEAAPVIGFATPGLEFVSKFWGGTAPCDWLDADLEATPTTVVVITFAGNSLTRCMRDRTGAQLIDEALVERYRADVGVLIDRAKAAGAAVVLVGQPLRHPRFDADVEVDGINRVYRMFAAIEANVSYVDAGQQVETRDGYYTERLPCAPFDADCSPGGTTIVRGDGVHFCPIADITPCPVWSSGAARFGLAIAAAVNDPEAFD